MANGKIVFFGTAEICIPFRNELNKHFSLELIITQPDRKGGRKNKIITSPVKEFAVQNNIRYIQPEDLNDDVKKQIARIKPAIAIVIAYGKFIPRNIYTIPKYNTINVHFSLLPEYRGAAPVQRAIANGDTKTGITIFEISKKMDAGRIWSINEFSIERKDTTESLWKKLSEYGAHILIKTIKNIFNKSIDKQRQNHANATYASPIYKSEGEIDWADNAKHIYNKFRAFYPWPGIFFKMNNRIIKLKDVEISKLIHEEKTGQILKLDKSGLYITCGDNTVLRIISFQPEGKKEMTPYNFSVGNKVELNDNNKK
jgi:methionyl-tRNA formyltransferase